LASELFTKFGRWFHDALQEPAEEPKPGSMRARAGINDSPKESDSENKREIERLGKNIGNRLREIFKTGQPVPTGCLHLVGFETLRERLGDRWLLVKERVHDIARKLISRHTSPQDVWFRCGSDDYVVVFATLSKEPAQLVCARIVEELHSLLLGNTDTATISVRTLVTQFNGAVDLEETTLATLLANVRSDPPPQVEDQSQRTRPPLTRPTLEPVEFLYHPFWDVRRKVLSTYLCRAHRKRRGASSLTDYAVLPDRDSPGAIAALDINLLKHSLEILEELYANKFRMVISIPVNFETLANSSHRWDWVRAARSIPDDLRPLVAFTLFDLPIGVPSGRLAELLGIVRPFCRTVMITTKLEHTNLSVFSGTKVSIVIASAPRNAPDSKAIAAIGRFTAAAQLAGLQSCIDDITNPILARAAQSAGAAFIGGSEIGLPREVPEHMKRFIWQASDTPSQPNQET
jgi:hypothetical protein